MIEKSFALWSFVLYAIYLVFLVWSLSQFFGDKPWPSTEIKPGWFLAGVKYAGYNMVAIPALLFCIRHIERRREAVGAGILVGPIGMIPAFFFYFAMVTQYPAVVDQTVPANFLLEALGSTAFQVVFQVVLLGTLIESGTGMIHAFNERVAGVLAERPGRPAGLSSPGGGAPAAAGGHVDGPTGIEKPGGPGLRQRHLGRDSLLRPAGADHRGVEDPAAAGWGVRRRGADAGPCER